MAKSLKFYHYTPVSPGSKIGLYVVMIIKELLNITIIY